MVIASRVLTWLQPSLIWDRSMIPSCCTLHRSLTVCAAGPSSFAFIFSNNPAPQPSGPVLSCSDDLGKGFWTQCVCFVFSTLLPWRSQIFKFYLLICLSSSVNFKPRNYLLCLERPPNSSAPYLR
jgi:hypothetical protein